MNNYCIIAFVLFLKKMAGLSFANFNIAKYKQLQDPFIQLAEICNDI